MLQLAHLGLAMLAPSVAPNSRSFRPPSWPPPRDWVCIEDEQGVAVSRWGDPIWRLDPWARKCVILNFGDGPNLSHTTPIDRNNADILRLLVTWRIWGPRGAKSVSSIRTAFFPTIRAIVELCSREGILASDLTRFPQVAAKIPLLLAPSLFSQTVTELHRILDSQQSLGFTLLDREGLKKLVACKPDHLKEQTEYIPPRILEYQRKRLRDCLDDYLMHKLQVERCFKFCVDAYANSNGSLSAALTQEKRGGPRLFRGRILVGPPKKKQKAINDYFMCTAKKFGIKDLIEKWVEVSTPKNNDRKGITLFTKYLSLVRDSGYAYILNFSLMRQTEGRSLRADCLYIEDDEKLGKIPILCGETTKTDPDSDARWPTSPSAIIAIEAITSVARLRMRCAMANPKVKPTKMDIANPFLVDRAYEPWSNIAVKDAPYKTRKSDVSYAKFIETNTKLFDTAELIVTEEEFKIAIKICPTLNTNIFQVGKPWRLAWHQLRRTGSVDMLASGIISDSTLQHQLKHRRREMSLYYGRGSSKLALSADAINLLVNAQYEVMGRELSAVLSDRFVSPHGDEHKKMIVAELLGQDISLLSAMDANHFEDAAQSGTISFRKTVLGGCMKNGTCAGDCIDSIASCAGGANSPPCRDVLFDRQRADQNKIRLEGVKIQIEVLMPNSPRYKALAMEKAGLENYFAYIARGW